MQDHTFGVNIPGDKHEFDPERWSSIANGNGNSHGNNDANTNGIANRTPERHPETGIDVLIVGAGMGGLMTALECWRDIIAILPSVTSTIRHWPDMMRDLEADQVYVDLTYETHDGKHIFGPTTPSFNDPEHLSRRKGPSPAAAQIRHKFFRMFLRQVARVGLRIEYGAQVREYFEDEAAGKGGVILAPSKSSNRASVRVADVVVAADGIRSRSETLITGSPEPQPATSSGMSIYRCSYPRSLAMKDPVVRERWGDGDSKSWEFWLGPGMYMGIFMSPDLVAWGFTPREEPEGDGATESWEPDVDPDTVADMMMSAAPDWHPAVPALVRTAPRGAVVHWPLLWRNLRRTWTSRGGRVVQVGDSAHTFTPTSGNGATQALEDAVTLATCLQLGGSPRSAGTAAMVYNLLRYERVSCAQKMSFVNAELKTDTNWDAIWADPAKIRTRFPAWIFSHDPEAYAYEKYGQAFANIIAGEEFQNTNKPPGHKFVPWTIEQLYKDIAQGKRMEDLLDGDWS